jgi:Fe-S-cluster-containing dehydrogenase component
MAKNILLVNLERCTGCWTCSMACKVAHDIPGDCYWQFVRTIGGGGIDVPKGTYPNIYMSWMPIWSQECIKCTDRTTEGNQPYCVYSCNTKALTYGDADDPESSVSRRMEELKDRGFHFFEIPVWEKTREHVLYANRVDVL